MPLQLLHGSSGPSAGTLRSELGQAELSSLVGVPPSPLCSRRPAEELGVPGEEERIIVLRIVQREGAK